MLASALKSCLTALRVLRIQTEARGGKEPRGLVEKLPGGGEAIVEELNARLVPDHNGCVGMPGRDDAQIFNTIQRRSRFVQEANLYVQRCLLHRHPIRQRTALREGHEHAPC